PQDKHPANNGNEFSPFGVRPDKIMNEPPGVHPPRSARRACGRWRMGSSDGGAILPAAVAKCYLGVAAGLRHEGSVSLLIALLRAQRHGLSGYTAAKKRDELPSPHGLTQSQGSQTKL